MEKKQLKIMPLGDSITEGHDIPGGYRVPLWNLLTSAGVCFKMVGSLSHGPKSFPNPEHEGHSGWRIDQINIMIQDWLTLNPPDIILLMIGTNDIAQNYPVEIACERIIKLVDHILELSGDLSLFIASIPPIDEPTYNAKVIEYNKRLEQLVRTKPAITFVDIYAVLSFEDLPDQVHPNELGYLKIAQKWNEVLSRSVKVIK